MPEWLSLAVSRETVRKAFRTSARERTPAQAAIDESLREYLREWRRAIAKEQGLPAYVVMHDSTLDEICRMRPVSIAQLRTITGIGERKAELYGQEILRALEQYHNGARAAELQAKASPMQETLELLQGGKTLEEIAATRGRQMSTVINTVATLVEAGEVEFSPQWISSEKLAVIQAAFSRLGIDGSGRLKPLKEVLPPEITYQEIRLVVARIRRETARNSAGVNTRPESLAPIRPTIASH
jgi:ATP-dependent DNA helicase RecQ